MPISPSSSFDDLDPGVEARAPRESPQVLGSPPSPSPMPSRTVPEQTLRFPVRALQLEVTAGPDKGTRHTSRSDRITLGSADDNDVTLTDETVSRYHLELLPTPQGIAVKDLGSTNGTWLGEARITEAVVPAGTRLKLGRTQVKAGEAGDVQVEL